MYEIYCKLRDSKGYKDSDIARITGITKSTFSDWKSGRSNPKNDKLLKIAKALDVPLEVLLGEETDHSEPQLNARDEKDIQKHLDMFREQLMSQEGLMFNGDPASPEAIESILQAMEVGMALAKKKNKERFTPKKYRKKD
jgi:transcriptional regulator with XRE-family HTH domain